jgi:hypothetical protein
VWPTAGTCALLSYPRLVLFLRLLYAGAVGKSGRCGIVLSGAGAPR